MSWRPRATSHFGWILGYTIGIVVVLVVVALVVPILLLATSIGDEAPKINAALTDAVHNTAALAELRTTIEHATSSSAGWPAAAPGWEARHACTWPCPPTSTPPGLGRIILGFVVVVAVAALLTLLVWLVKRIDRGSWSVRDTLKAAEANTADTVSIPQVADGVEAVLAEGLQHHLFLGRVLGKVKS